MNAKPIPATDQDGHRLIAKLRPQVNRRVETIEKCLNQWQHQVVQFATENAWVEEPDHASWRYRTTAIGLMGS